MTSKERIWKNILVHRPFQIKLISYFILLFFLTTVSLYSTTYLFFWNMQKKGLRVGIPEGHVYYQFLANQKNDLDLLFIALVSLNFILLVSVGLILSHRIAGPISKIVKHLSDPELSRVPIEFRKNDYFQEIPPLINKLRGL